MCAIGDSVKRCFRGLAEAEAKLNWAEECAKRDTAFRPLEKFCSPKRGREVARRVF